MPKANMQHAKSVTELSNPRIQRINMKIKITLRHKDLKAKGYPHLVCRCFTDRDGFLVLLTFPRGSNLKSDTELH